MPDSPADRMVRLTFLLRMVAVALTLVQLADGSRRSGAVVVGLLASSGLSFVALRWWHWLGPVLRQHPLVLTVDVAGAIALLVVAGPTSPFFHYTLATALLGGALHGATGGAGTAAALWVGYAVACRVAPGSGDPTFLVQVGLPSLYPLAALGAAGLAEVLREQEEAAERDTARARDEAGAQERARLARDLHDSVAATTQGVALQAEALAGQLARRCHPLAPAAGDAAAGARQAAIEARRALVALRTAPVRPDLHGELAAVVDEAVRNAARHAPGATVTVTTEVTASGRTQVVVRDDGPGFDLAGRSDRAPGDTCFGLVGMTERMAGLGGSLRIASRPGGGTVVVARLPDPPEALAS